jgi:hypothetical protein
MPRINTHQAKLFKSVMSRVIALFEDSPSAATDDWPNQWYDLVSQARDGESYFWDLYQSAMDTSITVELRNLTQQEIEVLWQLTENCFNYEFDVRWYQEHLHEMEPDELEKEKPTKPEVEEQIESVAELVFRLIMRLAESVELDDAIKHGKKKQGQKIPTQFLIKSLESHALARIQTSPPY